MKFIIYNRLRLHEFAWNGRRGSEIGEFPCLTVLVECSFLDTGSAVERVLGLRRTWDRLVRRSLSRLRRYLGRLKSNLKRLSRNLSRLRRSLGTRLDRGIRQVEVRFTQEDEPGNAEQGQPIVEDALILQL